MFLEINGVFIIWGIYCEYYIGSLDKIVSWKKLMLEWLFLYFDNIFIKWFKKVSIIILVDSNICSYYIDVFFSLYWIK